MIAIPSNATPICVPLAGYPNPYATWSSCNLLTVLLASLGSRCCAIISMELSRRGRRPRTEPVLPEVQLVHQKEQLLAEPLPLHFHPSHALGLGRIGCGKLVERISLDHWHLRISLVNLSVPHWRVVRDLGSLRIQCILHRRLAGAMEWLRLVLRVG